ncbi:MAG: TerD family protein [Thermoguttaceae bacterium]|nr:TerD family protein [Thermoguttaceae bacterium]
MTVLLLKGQKATLGLAATRLRVGLGWNPRVNVGEEFDLDVSCFMLGSDDKVRSKNDLVFYNQTESPRGSVKHTGDNQTGEGGGDDEAILVDLTQVPDDVAKLLFVATIHEARERRQNFGIVDEAYMRVVDRDTNAELARFDLSEHACVEHSLVFGSLVKSDAGWEFCAIGKGVADELPEIARSLGV